MQAVILWTLGTSWPHSRRASPVHICCASDEKAGSGRTESAVAAEAMAMKSAILLVRWKVIDAFPKVARGAAAIRWGAARGLDGRTRHPSRGNHPVWLLDFCRCSNQKCCAAPLRIMRQCCEAAMACVNTFLNCCVHATSSEARDARQRGFDACAFARLTGFEEGTDAGRCVCVLRPRSNGGLRDRSWMASGRGRCPARLRPAGRGRLPRRKTR